MLTHKTRLYSFFSFLTLIFFFLPNLTCAQSVSLHTPITTIKVPPGQDVNYNLTAINNSNSIKTSNIKLVNLPKDWSYELKYDSWNIEQISILPKKQEKLSLKIKVPLKVDKGSYKFKVIAEGYSSLPLTVIVSKNGIYQTEFSCIQPNIEGASDASFSYNATIKNNTAEDQVYSLKATRPSAGWYVTFKANGKQVSSVGVKANQTQNVFIEVKPASFIKSGTYKIPVSIRSGNIYEKIDLETVITGSYDIKITTHNGLLSTHANAGESKKIKLLITNNGSSALNKIVPKGLTPPKWTVDFSPEEIPVIEAGKSEEIEATINVFDHALSGDYEVNFNVKASETSSKQKFRVTVHTSILSGWFGILIIVFAIGCVYYLIRKYGRR